ncbi:MAG: hypothetical protein D6693_11265, partial [Planctomycetota bacterium]
MPDTAVIVTERVGLTERRLIRGVSGADGRVLFTTDQTRRIAPDLDADGAVTSRDLALLLARLGEPAPDPGLAAGLSPDLDGDGLVATPDLALLLARLGQQSPSSVYGGRGSPCPGITCPDGSCAPCRFPGAPPGDGDPDGGLGDTGVNPNDPDSGPDPNAP